LEQFNFNIKTVKYVVQVAIVNNEVLLCGHNYHQR